LIKLPYFADTTERGYRGVKAGPKTGSRQGHFTDNSNFNCSLREKELFWILNQDECGGVDYVVEHILEVE